MQQRHPEPILVSHGPSPSRGSQSYGKPADYRGLLRLVQEASRFIHLSDPLGLYRFSIMEASWERFALIATALAAHFPPGVVATFKGTGTVKVLGASPGGDPFCLGTSPLALVWCTLGWPSTAMVSRALDAGRPARLAAYVFSFTNRLRVKASTMDLTRLRQI